jgi:hypothetical protein
LRLLTKARDGRLQEGGAHERLFGFLTAKEADARKLARPLPDGALKIVRSGGKQGAGYPRAAVLTARPATCKLCRYSTEESFTAGWPAAIHITGERE